MFVHEAGGEPQVADGLLMKMFELMRSALIADNSQVVVEGCVKIIFEISQWRRVQKMTCLYHVLILLERFCVLLLHS